MNENVIVKENLGVLSKSGDLRQIVPFLIVLGLFLIIDIPVILYFNKSMYQDQFKRINKSEGPSGIRVYLSAIFAYILLAISIYFFIVRPEMDNYKPEYLNILLKGLVMGLVVYGVYNGTNMATINEWGTKEFIIDTVWGTMLSGTLAISSVYFSKLLGY
jgi:uncharacterized membrane protein